MPDTLAVIEEFLSASERAETRRNAATALGALASDVREDHLERSRRSLHRLARITLSDPSPEVCQHAASVLRRAAAGRPGSFDETGLVTDTAGDRDQQRRAYALLGTLRAEGLVRRPRGIAGSLRRLPLVVSLRSLPNPEAATPFRWRGVWTTTAGGVAGGLALSLLASLRLPSLKSDIAPLLLVVGPLLASFIGLLATQRVFSAQRHYDRLAGGLAELGHAVSRSAPVALVLAIVFTLFADVRDQAWSGWLLGSVAIFAVVAATRLGVYLSYGIATEPRRSFALAACSGTVYGLVSATLLAKLYEPFFGDDDWINAVNGSWALSWPIAAGLAVAFADLERRSGALRREPGRARRFAIGLPVVACAALYLVAMVGRPAFDALRARGSTQKPPALPELLVAEREKPLGFALPPNGAKAQAKFRQVLLGATSLQVYRFDTGEDVLVQPTPTSNGGSLWLMTPGSYRIQRSPEDSEASEERTYSLASLRPELGNLFFDPAAEVAPWENAELTLNAFGEVVDLAPDVPLVGTADKTVAGVWQVAKVPFEARIRTSSAERVYSALPDRDSGAPDFTLTLKKDDREIATSDDPPKIEETVRSGDYVLRAELYGSMAASSGDLARPVELLVIMGPNAPH